MSDQDFNEFEYDLDTKGFSVIEGFLSLDDISYLKKLLSTKIEEASRSGYKSERAVLDKMHIHDLLTQDLRCCQLLEDKRLNKLLASILGEFWTLYAFTSSSVPPGSSNYGARVHVDSPRWVKGYPTNVGVIWALDNFTLENGGTRVLPGSHHSEVIPGGSYFEENSVQLECPAGSLIIFNARLVHATGFNNSDQFRHALTMNACRSYMKQRMNWVEMIPMDIVEKLNCQAKRIIGYDTRVPSSMETFFVPDTKRLYKPGQG